jgi:hypothetical protein
MAQNFRSTESVGTASQVAEKLASTHYNGAEFPVVQVREGHGFSRADTYVTKAALAAEGCLSS